MQSKERSSTATEKTAEQAALAELAFLMWLRDENGYLAPQPLLHRRGWYAAVMPLAFTHAIVGGRIGDKISISFRYCYAGRAAALAALDAWQREGGPEPDGWHRDPRTGRRRPDGDRTRECIEW